jgi:hypothetical protein
MKQAAKQIGSEDKGQRDSVPCVADDSATSKTAIFKYFIQHNGEHWQSIFPAVESDKSQLHTDADDAFAYMHYECGVPAEAIRVVPLAQFGVGA